MLLLDSTMGIPSKIGVWRAKQCACAPRHTRKCKRKKQNSATHIFISTQHAYVNVKSTTGGDEVG